MRRVDLFRAAKETMTFTEKFMKQNDDFRPAKVEVFSPESLKAIEDDEDELFERAFWGTDGAEFRVVNADSFDAAYLLDHALVMNFANAHRPGGGFLTGARAQEESLCRCSTLYASIASAKAKEMYDYNNALGDPCDSDYMLLSRYVYVFQDKDLNRLDNPFWTSVVTVPAPNKNGRASSVSQEKLDSVMLGRLRKMLFMAAHEGYRKLVLGAWGTGAFGHDTRMVAEYFYTLFFEEGFNEFFETVVFAILGDDDKVKIFKDVFGDKIRESNTNTMKPVEEMNLGYYELAYEMPLCNHKEGLSDKNIGFAQGVTYDGVPFEVELTDDGKVQTLCVIMPSIYDSNPVDEPDEEDENNLIGFHFDIDEMDYSILDIGMVDEGEEDEMSVIQKYVDFLVDHEIISFASNVQNGSVFYRVDSLGNDLTKILITLRESEDIWAYTDLTFKSMRKHLPDFRVIN